MYRQATLLACLMRAVACVHSRSVVEDVEDSTMIFNHSTSSADLANHGLTLAEFDRIISSEANYDFGVDVNGDEIGEQGEDFGSHASLFLAASEWQWDLNAQDPNTYYPYILCNTNPELSGYRRILELKELFAGDDSSYGSGVFIGDTIVNLKKSRTCVWSSARVDDFRKMVQTRPQNATQYIEYQPHLFGMKIIDGTVDILSERFLFNQYRDNSAGTTYSTAQDEGTSEKSKSALPDSSRRLGLELNTCPVVKEYIEQGLAEANELTSHIRSFLVSTADVNSPVQRTSFYLHATMNDNIPTTPRMDWWASKIQSVADMTDASTGSNVCFDFILEDRLTIQYQESQTIAVRIAPFGLADIDGEMSDEQLEDCLWYVLAGVALHPYVCQVSPEFYPEPPILPGISFGQETSSSSKTVPETSSSSPSSSASRRFLDLWIPSVTLYALCACALLWDNN